MKTDKPRRVSAHAALPVGSRFGKLVTTGEPYQVRKYYSAGRLQPMWEVEVQCDCGTKKTALVWQLKGFRTVSCGCVSRDKHSRIVFTKGYRKPEETC